MWRRWRCLRWAHELVTGWAGLWPPPPPAGAGRGVSAAAARADGAEVAAAARFCRLGPGQTASLQTGTPPNHIWARPGCAPAPPARHTPLPGHRTRKTRPWRRRSAAGGGRRPLARPRSPAQTISIKAAALWSRPGAESAGRQAADPGRPATPALSSRPAPGPPPTPSPTSPTSPSGRRRPRYSRLRVGPPRPRPGPEMTPDSSRGDGSCCRGDVEWSESPSSCHPRPLATTHSPSAAFYCGSLYCKHIQYIPFF